MGESRLFFWKESRKAFRDELQKYVSFHVYQLYNNKLFVWVGGLDSWETPKMKRMKVTWRYPDSNPKQPT